MMIVEFESKCERWIFNTEPVISSPCHFSTLRIIVSYVCMNFLILPVIVVGRKKNFSFVRVFLCVWGKVTGNDDRLSVRTVDEWIWMASKLDN